MTGILRHICLQYGAVLYPERGMGQRVNVLNSQKLSIVLQKFTCISLLLFLTNHYFFLLSFWLT